MFILIIIITILSKKFGKSPCCSTWELDQLVQEDGLNPFPVYTTHSELFGLKSIGTELGSMSRVRIAHITITVSGISIRSSALVLISKNKLITLPLSFISIDGIFSAGLTGQLLNKLS